MPTAKYKYDNAKTWQGKIKYMAFYHNFTRLKGSGSVRKTAKYFKVSVGLVSENMRLAKFIDKLNGVKTRQEAIQIIIGKEK